MQRDKEDNVRHELDDQFASLRELIYAPDPSSSGSNSVPLGARETGFKAPTPSEADPAVSTTTADANDYDQHVRELAFDKRAKPKDRTKTEEELALEAKEALEKAERRRRKRMLGLNDESSDEEDGKAKDKRKRGADDLDDDFDEEGVPDYDGLGAGLAAKTGSEDDDEDEDDEEGSDEEEEGSEEGSEEGEEDGGSEVEVDDSDDGSEGEEGEQEHLVAPSRIAKGKSKGKKSAKQELPFTFPCPASHDEFLEIVEDIDDDDVPIVVQRIRALYHTSLGVDNKFKLQVCTFFRAGYWC